MPLITSMKAKSGNAGSKGGTGGRQPPDDFVQLAHGSGGRLSQELVESLFGIIFSNPYLDRMDDSAVLEAQGKLACTIDSHVVSPLFFPGGDIGRLAITGTVNDLAMSGAKPLYISTGFIMEEGLSLSDLEILVRSMRSAADEAGVMIVAGDTKVVERGAADGLFITTSGIGVIPPGVEISASRVEPGDKIIVSGTIGDHGTTILSRREGMAFESQLRSDCAPLGDLVAVMLAASPDIHAMRDPTRGGLAATLNEIAAASDVALELEESNIPYNSQVRAACELLGLDPLSLANEGKLVAFVPPGAESDVLEAMRAHPHGSEAAIIGEAVAGEKARVYLRTQLGSRRVLAMPSGEQLPRIC